MRLICPNCGAQYEVPEEVIPPGGRDVQCSDCSHTWFQHHPDHPAEDGDEGDDALADEEDPSDPAPVEPSGDDYGADEDNDDPEPDAEDEPEEDAEEAWETEQAYEPDPDPESEPDLEPDTDIEPALQRRTLDPEIADVLREEAERETKAREEERGGIETQQELGLQETDDGAQKRTEEARARMARLRGESETDTSLTDDDIDPASRRNLLPDIEEINSSLAPEAAREDMASQTSTSDEGMVARPKSGFRSGFRLAVLLALLALLVYVFAPQLTNAVPALEGPLSSFVDTINSGRLALSEMMQNFATSLSDDGAADG